MTRNIIIHILLLMTLVGCQGNWNDPYPAQEGVENTLYTAFSSRPKHLDPARSYSSNEVVFTAQIYEPPLQYHYLKRPYELEPLAVTEMPRVEFLDAEMQPLPADAASESVTYSRYELQLRPGIHYQPHPAFAADTKGHPRYLGLTEADLEDVYTLSDFLYTGTRELVAADYVYQIKRLAHPQLHSPILGVMAEYIVGLREYAQLLAQSYREGEYLDLTQYSLPGVEVVDRYTYRITVHGKYPQLLYWLAMPFFAPVPPEADRFYSQPGMAERNLTLDWYPVGTGPYMLTVNNPNRQMVLARNPNFHEEFYPVEGAPGDDEAGLLDDAGKRLPFIDKVIFTLEKENIPYWNKFQQGYYDTSGVSSDSFDQAVAFSSQGEITLTPELREKGIRLQTAVATSIFYFGFNMQDPVVGGDSERARKLRQAIAIAVDYEEFISIFANGRGIPAQGPIPPGIFGFQEGEGTANPYVYDDVDGRIQRKPISEAKRLLAEAGYPDGRDSITGKPLLLYFDVTAGGPDDKSMLDWWRKQFQKLNIQLVIRNTDYNRFQEKMRKGNAQLFQWGWNADYPDPENFLFLLYGPNAKARFGGENAANYSNPEFDRLFEQMKTMDNGAARQRIIDRMVDIVRHDSPWLWGFHPKQFSLLHQWFHNAKPNMMANNTLKYRRIEPQLRHEARKAWNRPIVWPLVVIAVIVLLAILPAVVAYRRRERRTMFRGETG